VAEKLLPKLPVAGNKGQYYCIFGQWSE